MFKKKKVRVKRILLYIFAFSVLGLACVIYVFPTLTGALTPTSLVEYGRLRVAANETCYIIRDEAVVTATASGKIQYYLDEGELARKGTKIADVISSGSGHVTDKNILVSYYVDGYEEVFTPENMTALKKKDVESIEFTVNNVKRESAIAGEPLYKTVDNSAWYIAIWAKPENVIKYEKGKSVYVNLPLGEVKGTTYDIIDMD
ncbi:MAG TPA: HlyD family efflux transporter periplasmic adaptor subunit, partial [Anaerovoracaceae bacterium]|nr:HlyD family efflux transporter periplasmic adaptor subunit [Anaerovoracaceae bacterium]